MKVFKFFLFGVLITYSQSKYSNDFLSIGLDSRSISMSNSVVSSTNDLTSVFYNPAGLNNVSNYEFGIMHSSYFAGIADFDYVGFAMPIDSSFVLGVALIRFGVDDIPNTTELLDQNGNINYNNISTFSSSDFAAIFSFANSTIFNLKYGLSTKIIHRKIGPFASSWGFGLDLGLQYSIKNWNLGLFLNDFTSTLNFWNINQDEYSEQYLESGNYIPEDGIELTAPKVKIGVSRIFSLYEDFSLLSEANFNVTWDGKRNTVISTNLFSIDPSLGLEFDYKKIGFLRLGIGNFQQEQLIDSIDEEISFQPNFGIGVNIWSFIIDYSLTDLGNASTALYSNVFTVKYKW